MDKDVPLRKDLLPACNMSAANSNVLQWQEDHLLTRRNAAHCFRGATRLVRTVNLVALSGCMVILRPLSETRERCRRDAVITDVLCGVPLGYAERKGGYGHKVLAQLTVTSCSAFAESVLRSSLPYGDTLHMHAQA